ncbi:glycosyl hydrolase family 18 protein [Cellvibrio sp. OA-2007]|uniref:glycosyl hydrolase family 18 protein n=1 Tax=Cellvibrio sp. OA-2007 TaxID=529823 RepID=UPI000786462E|nr:glycosyl hydrolase family 18 protein [Cellvibrio sp. OA-2007]
MRSFKPFTLLSSLGLLSVAAFASVQAQAYNCSNVAAYKQGTYANGAVVQNAGSAYSCTVGGWCTVGGPYEPGVGWAWANAWSSLGACDGVTTSSAASSVASVASSSKSSVQSSVVVSSIAASSVASVAGCGGVAAWDSAAVYNGGNQASRNGALYQAKWWTQGNDPVTNSGTDGVWVNKGACGTASSSVVSSVVASSTPSSVAPSSSSAPSSVVPSSSSKSSVASSVSSSASSVPPVGGKKVVGYFAEWGIYGRNYHVKNIATSGSAAQLTHILYSFGNVQNGKCTIGDSYAAYDKAYDAAGSVDGVADTWDQPLRGNFNQLRKLKAMNPNLKVIWSFGGWTWSDGFPQAAQNPTAFADSCYALVEDPRWADVFDGIDIDWEYPNECGLKCDTTSGFSGYKNLMQALRARFGSNALITSAIGAGTAKINAADYAGAAQYVDFYMPMTYDFFGAWDKTGPTSPHSALYDYAGIPKAGYNSDNAIQLMKSKGIPASKILLGVGFYGRGWTGVTQAAPGGSATGAAAGTYEAGIDDYKVLKSKCPATGTVGGTAYAFCGGNWWSYDTPQTLVGKMDYVHQQGLAGTFFWELSGDTNDGELIRVIGNAMR